MEHLSEIEQQLADLRKQHGERWEVWIVHRVYGGPVWCARLHDDHKHVLHASSAEELEQDITEARIEQ